MAPASNPPLNDVAILTGAVESVFRKLICMLMGRMSLKKLQEMIQVIFVEEAEKMLQHHSQEQIGKMQEEVEKLCGKGQVYIQMLQEEQWERQKLEGLYSILGLQETIEEK